MAFAYSDMLTVIKDRQWALADIDWDAPGAERITEAQRPKLAAFMADLVWIEHVGARGFAALKNKAPDGPLKEIYRYFHAEEQKHANAELALMRRWGMLDGDAMPVPNKNIRLVIEWLDRNADNLTLPVLGTVIPSLECALDGALVKFLLDEVRDPLCHEVFRNINSDESRHLAVGFQVLEQLGAGPARRIAIETAGFALRPSLLLGALLYTPLLSRMSANIMAMGLDEEKLWNAVRRYEKAGERAPEIKRLPLFHVVRLHGRATINRLQPLRTVNETLSRAIDLFPVRVLGKPPSWSKELTYEPVAR
ncbi:ferritin-like domain-containing protein [Nocardia huaxiensis]|uniref:Ferritin-like domain-containing protein n=1 Tax=Nocardia huaxiensis TaxID=2755382 RepID=A0A7D6ZPC3_9NOCA|nr:ferritin-like domain-containing protein [Nocardia huaxiensis]QLY32103.1 ferritin-like domain-containing protein [Nocardia huaxiensis]UFS95682.1 ferritin-like domain-containing protein [Nocardia huaxiensis]